MDFNPETIENIIKIALQVVGAASVIATFTPTPKDNLVLGVLKKVLDVLAANVGKAKNKE